MFQADSSIFFTLKYTYFEEDNRFTFVKGKRLQDLMFLYSKSIYL